MEKILFFTLRLGLFLLIANVFMLFLTAPMSAEWIVSMISAVLMAVLVAAALFIKRRHERKNDKKDGAENE